MEGSADGSPALRHAMLDVYAKVDEGIAALREAAGADAVTVVVVSHGMGPIVGGPQLLPEVLVRLGAGSGHGAAAQVRSRLPIGLRRVIRKLVPGGMRRRLQEAAGSLPSPLASPATRATALPADVNGYVRLNLLGREPHGSVAPAEADSVLAEIRRALLELRDPASGEPIVSQIVSADEAFGPERSRDVPDLMVGFRTDLGRLDACESERVGLIRVPFRVANRSGDHTGEARLWVAGPLDAAHDRNGRAHSLDIAPTILSLLDVPIPAELEGRPLADPTEPPR
jgi:predicted AlkP superfamily phosphohydrolase/phosphomutase